MNRAISFRGQVANQEELPRGYRTQAEIFQEAGYRTYGVNSNIHIRERFGFAQGFDHFIYTDFSNSDAIEREIRKFADEVKSGSQPAFVYIHYVDPHWPYEAREPWIGPLAEH